MGALLSILYLVTLESPAGENGIEWSLVMELTKAD